MDFETKYLIWLGVVILPLTILRYFVIDLILENSFFASSIKLTFEILIILIGIHMLKGYISKNQIFY